MATEGEVWHLVEARRDDGSPTMFRIRELEPRLDHPRIFVVELPYPITELSRMPDAAAYRRFQVFEEQWLGPACVALGWTPVAIKIEDGSFFVYLYGKGESLPLIEWLSPFDGALGFFDEADPTWDEYAALRELLEEAKAITPDPEPAYEEVDEAAIEASSDAVPLEVADQTQLSITIEHAALDPRPKPRAEPAAATQAPSAKARPLAKAKAKARQEPKAKARQEPKAKAKPKPKPKPKAKTKPKPSPARRRRG